MAMCQEEGELFGLLLQREETSLHCSPMMGLFPLHIITLMPPALRMCEFSFSFPFFFFFMSEFVLFFFFSAASLFLSFGDRLSP